MVRGTAVAAGIVREGSLSGTRGSPANGLVVAVVDLVVVIGVEVLVVIDRMLDMILGW
jgi:hypothetical protein